MQLLRLEIITPDGQRFAAQDVDRVVFRRREFEYEQGSEVAIFPCHGPLLTRVPCTSVRFTHGGETHYLAIEGGFIEVKESRILTVTPRFADCGCGPEARAQATSIAQKWLEESGDFLAAMTGFE